MLSLCLKMPRFSDVPSVKRFAPGQLQGETVTRRPGHNFQCEYAKSSKATCRKCKAAIPEGTLRLALMMEQDEGYKSTYWYHFDCFWTHPETRKLHRVQELKGFSDIAPVDQRRIEASFSAMRSSVTSRAKATPVALRVKAVAEPAKKKAAAKKAAPPSSKKKKASR